VGSLTTSLSVGYNWCETGNFVIGIITAILNPGYIEVVKADGYSVLFQEGCDFTGYPVTGGKAYIGAGECDPGLATEPSTWGQVKALYR
jgi:hypothetical protein